MIHKGRLYRIFDDKVNEKSTEIYIESEFRSLNDVVSFANQLDDIIQGRIAGPAPNPTPPKKRQRMEENRELILNTLVTMTNIDGTHSRWTLNPSHPKAMRLDVFDVLFDFVVAKIKELLPAVNNTPGHCVIIRQGIWNGTQTELILDEDGNVCWTAGKRRIQTKCSRNAYNKLKNILLSDKKHKNSIERPQVSDYSWRESLIYFEAQYTTGDETGMLKHAKYHVY